MADETENNGKKNGKLSAGELSRAALRTVSELTGYQAKTGERLWWARGVTNGPAAPPLIDGDAIYTLEPTGAEPPPFSQMLKEFDKNQNGKIELSEISGETVNDKIMYRLFKSIDKIGGNGDGVVTEDEYKSSFDSPIGNEPEQSNQHVHTIGDPWPEKRKRDRCEIKHR